MERRTNGAWRLQAWLPLVWARIFGVIPARIGEKMAVNPEAQAQTEGPRPPGGLILTSDEIDGFLLRRRKQSCSWCGEQGWGFHTIQANAISEGSEAKVGDPELRAVARVRLGLNDAGGIKGAVSMGPDQSLIVAAAECLNCGHVDFFNYFAVRRLMQEEAQRGNNSPN